MNGKEIQSAFSPELRAQLERALSTALTRSRDPELMRLACERMDRMREANRIRFGEQNIGVDFIREMRDSR